MAKQLGSLVLLLSLSLSTGCAQLLDPKSEVKTQNTDYASQGDLKFVPREKITGRGFVSGSSGNSDRLNSQLVNADSNLVQLIDSYVNGFNQAHQDRMAIIQESANTGLHPKGLDQPLMARLLDASRRIEFYRAKLLEIGNGLQNESSGDLVEYGIGMVEKLSPHGVDFLFQTTTARARQVEILSLPESTIANATDNNWVYRGYSFFVQKFSGTGCDIAVTACAGTVDGFIGPWLTFARGTHFECSAGPQGRTVQSQSMVIPVGYVCQEEAATDGVQGAQLHQLSQFRTLGTGNGANAKALSSIVTTSQDERQALINLGHRDEGSKGREVLAD